MWPERTFKNHWMSKGTSLEAEATLQTCARQGHKDTRLLLSARLQEVAQGAQAGLCTLGRGRLTSSPKVGEGPQLIVLSSAATMMLLFLRKAAAVTPAPRGAAPRPAIPAAPGTSVRSLQGTNLPAQNQAGPTKTSICEQHSTGPEAPPEARRPEQAQQETLSAQRRPRERAPVPTPCPFLVLGPSGQEATFRGTHTLGKGGDTKPG